MSTVAARVFTAQENKRYTDLAATGYGSVQNAQNAQARDNTATGRASSATRRILPRRKSRSSC